MQDIFTKIYHENGWGDLESVSGRGSNLEQTSVIRVILPQIFEQLEVKSLLDIPCGDFYWMNKVDLSGIDYLGADIVPELIDSNRINYPGVDFYVLDIVNDLLPECDLILARDILGHLSNAEVKAALRNIKESGAKYLLSTTFSNSFDTTDIKTGQWRPINLDYMWGLPEPLAIINEGCTEGDGNFADKSLGLWRINN